jgi:hypothetical protein
MTTTIPKAPKIRAFNTGRLYSEKGQRIGWAILSTGNVAMYDVDRMIDYVLQMAAPPQRNSDVLSAYDATARAPYNEAEYAEARALQSELIAAAQAL